MIASPLYAEEQTAEDGPGAGPNELFFQSDPEIQRISAMMYFYHSFQRASDFTGKKQE